MTIGQSLDQLHEEQERQLLMMAHAIEELENRVALLEEGAQEPTDPTPEPPPPPPGGGYILLSPDELPPIDHEGWFSVIDASMNRGDVALSSRSEHSAYTIAIALTSPLSASEEIRAVIDTPYSTSDVLAICRRLAAYPIAANFIGLAQLDPDLDNRFRGWLQEVLQTTFSGGGGGTVASVHERRPNNFGTHAGASRIACALYLGDDEELERATEVFRGWLGNRDSYAGFSYGDLSWQADVQNPVGINPAGSMITVDSLALRNVDGVLPDDQRRGAFTWPPPKENYVWEALQGAIAQAWMLYRAGQDAFSWEDQALRRAVNWLYTVCNYPAEGDDTGTPYVIDAVYGTSYASEPARPGKNGLGITYPFL